MKGSYLALVILLINVILVVFAQLLDATNSTKTINNKKLKRNVKLGMTWKWGARNDRLNIDWVGCNDCNPYIGDTPCNQALAILCVSDTKFKRPPYDILPVKAAMPSEFYNGWSGGNYLTTEPIVGSTIGSKANADKICSDRFGSEFIAMEHHLGRYVDGMNSRVYYFQSWPSSTSVGGWNATGYGKVSQTHRFWVFINNQPSNCWN